MKTYHIEIDSIKGNSVPVVKDYRIEASAAHVAVERAVAEWMKTDAPSKYGKARFRVALLGAA